MLARTLQLIFFSRIALIYAFPILGRTNIILSNDDGWAELNIRTFFDALTSAPYHFNVVLSAPSENRSGTGSSDAPPTVLNTTCQFDTCPVGSPPEGFNSSDPRFNYVNSFPVTSMRYGIQTLAPKFFKDTFGKPKIVVSGPNVGVNVGPGITGSGTVGAASEAALEGFPAIAFSGGSGNQVSYTSSLIENSYSPVYAALSAKLTNALLRGAEIFFLEPILPKKIFLNVNYALSNSTICSSARDFKFILTRLANATDTTPPDVVTCRNGGRLPTEIDVLVSTLETFECIATVTVVNATNKMDVDARTQEYALLRLKNVLSCFQ